MAFSWGDSAPTGDIWQRVLCVWGGEEEVQASSGDATEHPTTRRVALTTESDPPNANSVEAETLHFRRLRTLMTFLYC